MAEVDVGAVAAAWLEDELPIFRDTSIGHEVGEAVALAAGEAADDRTERVLAPLGTDLNRAAEAWVAGDAEAEAELIESVLALLDRMLDVRPEDVHDNSGHDDGDGGVLVLAS